MFALLIYLSACLSVYMHYGCDLKLSLLVVSFLLFSFTGLLTYTDVDKAFLNYFDLLVHACICVSARQFM